MRSCMAAAALGWSLVACGAGDPYVSLDREGEAVRRSWVLRGLPPSEAELDRVRDDPQALDALTDAWLDSPQFGEVVKDMHAEWLLVRADTIDPLPSMGPMLGTPLATLANSPAEAPLELVRHIVEEDLPYTEVVQATFMLTDPVVAKIYGLPYDPEGPRWQRSHWQDGRIHAGLLSSTELWRRHESAGSSFHRLRADLVATAFLCESFSGRDVVPEGGVSISDEFEVAEAVRTDPACISCHQTLDPLAAFFWGFKKQLRKGTVRTGYQNDCSPVPSDDPLIPYAWGDYCYPLQPYATEDEDWWAYWDLPAPAYYGQRGDTLADLGAFIAEDPRFHQCTARRFYGWMTQSDPLEVPLELVTHLQEVFVDHGFSAKALARAIVESPSFSGIGERGAPGVPAAGLQVVRPEQYARWIEAQTGFAWRVEPDGPACGDLYPDGQRCWGAVDLMRSDVFGFRSMFGGINGNDVNVPVHSPTPVGELVAQTFAAEAAAFAVDGDLGQADPGARRFLRQVDPRTTDEAAVRDQIAAWGPALWGRSLRPRGPEVDGLYALFAHRRARGAAREAWALVLTAMLTDPEAMFY